MIPNEMPVELALHVARQSATERPANLARAGYVLAREVERLRHELDEVHTWAGFVRLADAYFPRDRFDEQTWRDDLARDPGAGFVVQRMGAALDRLSAIEQAATKLVRAIGPRSGLPELEALAVAVGRIVPPG